MDRLTEAKYMDVTDTYNSGTGAWNSNYSTDNKFQENVQYDVRGNITFLQRSGLNDGSWTSNGYTAATYGLIDNLTYNYNGQNQVTKVVDASLADKGFIYKNASVSTAFTYDTNGNLTSDANKGITSIEYNYLNLPMKIVFNRTYLTSYNNGSIEFIYDATGAKLRKTVKDVNGNVLDTRDYVNGVEYNNGTLSRIAHTEGSVERNEFGAYEHQYVLRDHLGNTRITFRDGINKGEAYFDWTTYQYIDPNAGNTTGLNDGVITSADIMQINNYYPFGLNMEGNWNGAAGSNKYQYNEKEWNDDFGLGWYAYGFRYYDPSVCRFWSVDPLTEKFPYYTQYQFAGNRVPNAIDLEGLEEFLVIKSYDEDNHVKSIAINYHTNSEGLINQKLSNKNTGEDYSNYHVLNVNISANGNISYEGEESFDKLTQDVYDNKKDVTVNRADTKSNSMSVGESKDLQSKSDDKISTSHRKSGEIGINQNFEYRFYNNTLDKENGPRYLNMVRSALNSDEVPMYKIDGKDSNRIRKELEKRGVDSKKENKTMTSNIPLTSSSRVLYGKYFVK